MSRLTTAQIVELGDYLKPDFDPASLTVSQLLGVFGYHNVMYPTPYTKPKLVQLFNNEIKSKASLLKKERLSRQNSQASDDGITDGLTGRPLNEGRKPTTRAASRRASVAPQEKEQIPEPSRPDPPKRRRSSAEPSLGGTATTTRRRAAKAPEPVAEESEPEEPPVRKVSRKKTSQTEAATQSRQTIPHEDVDSGWEDNNIFQSGAESASPSPVKLRPRRSSAIPKRSKKSMSVPPQFAPPPPSPTKQDSSRIPRKRTTVKPPESDFEPELPEDVFRETRAAAIRTRRTTPDVIATSRHVVMVKEDEEEQKLEVVAEDFAGAIETDMGAEDDDEIQDAGRLTVLVAAETGKSEDDVAPMDYNDDSQSVISSQETTGQDLVRHKAKSSGFGLMRFLFFMFITASLSSLYNYKTESAPIGFCDTGKSTNAVLESVKVRRAAIEECNRMNRTTLYAVPYADNTQSVASPTPTPTPGDSDDSQLVLSEACPPPPLIPLPEPESCAPCPDHASCTPSTVTCDTGYLLRPHPLLAFLSLPTPSRPAEHAVQIYNNPSSTTGPTYGNLTVRQLTYTGLSLLLDGFPGLGPAAFPPRCVEDPRRKKHIGQLGKALDNTLMNERGRRHCDGARPEDDKPLSEVERAKKWGMQVDALKEHLNKKTAPQMLPVFDDLFNEAIQQLAELDSIFIGEDDEGHRYIATRDEKMDSLCKAKVWAVESGRNNWKQISSVVSAVALTITLWMRRQANSEDQTRAQTLAEHVYAMLRNAEFEHHVDQASRPVPYLSSLQLRDALLQSESIAERKRMWRLVEKIIGANANIVTSHEELEGGDEGVVWRWVGGVGKTVSYQVKEDVGEELVPAV